MQKDWIIIGTAACCGTSQGGNDAAGRAPAPVRPAGAVCCGGLSPWPSSLVPSCWSSQAPLAPSCWSCLDHQTQPEAAERTGAGSPAPLPQRNPLNEPERAPNPLRHRHQPVMPQHAALPVVSSPSASPRSWPSLTVFGGCQGIFPALTTPKNCCTTMRDRGDAEAQNVRRNPNEPFCAHAFDQCGGDVGTAEEPVGVRRLESGQAYVGRGFIGRRRL